MLSATVCLYAGEESVVRNRYPRDINLTTVFNSYPDMENYMGDMKESVKSCVGAAGDEIVD